ncbi:electron transfer flavoprotein subunit beta/FixA family protein [Paraburkholderia hayleyella]|uniref:electron transfer flavoprotein subunit beta/FixA family protein n=1 Tax=Paraburkholderia hayleyella TaxID=2152889 RepID=UPI0012912ACC|nr:electron transfer flavoprotein subunit beta/FixA family protein [Paraburkholderia hayleyella]
MSHVLQRIAVLVSVGCHPLNGAPRYSRNDALALEIARHLAQHHAAQLDVIHAGNPAHPALEDYLALGAARVDVLCCDSTRDDVAALLAMHVRGYDLILTGTCAEGAFDSGLLPYQIAAALDYPLLGAVVEAHLSDDGQRIAARQFLPQGRRRKVSVTLPAVLAIHPLASATPRYAYARSRAGSVDMALPALALAQNPSGDAPEHNETHAWRIVSTPRQAVKLTAPEKRSGAARMRSATTTESRGGSVVIEGSSVEKAQAILDYLREHQLIND